MQTRLKNSEKFLTRAGTKPRDPPSKEAQGREQKCYKGISGKAEPAAAMDRKDPENQIISAIWEPKRKTAAECFFKKVTKREKIYRKKLKKLLHFT